MSNLMPFIIAGIVAGAVYGLAATGLVLTYKTSGVFNFGHGAIGAAGAFVFAELWKTQGWPWPIALATVLLVGAPVVGLVLSVITARLSGLSTARRVVATVGILLSVQGAIQLRYGVLARSFDPPLPTTTVNILGTQVGYDQLITVAISGVALALLTALFRSTHIGLQMRAVVDNRELLSLSKASPSRVLGLAWVIGSVFAALTGVLIAPSVGLDSMLLTFLVIQAVGAAAIGRFENLTATFLGGLAIGVGQSLLRAPTIRDAIPFVDSLPGLPESVAFLLLFAILLMTRGGAFIEASPPRTERPSLLTGRQRTLVNLGLVAVVVMLPFIIDDRFPDLIQTAIFVSIFASLYMLVEVSGQVSLCHAAFVAVGATTFTHLSTGAGLPWLVAAVLSVLVVIPLGAVVAIPSIRVSGLFLALATFGFGVVLQQMMYGRGIMFGRSSNRFGSRPAFAGLDGDVGYFYLCAGAAGVCIATVVVVRRMRLGRLLTGLADSPTALVTHGSSVNVTRVIVFCLAAGMAAFGGVLMVGVVGSVSSSGASSAALISFNSLLWMVVLVLAGRNPILSPIAAAVVLFLLPSYNTSSSKYASVIFGAAVVVAVAFGPTLTRWVQRQVDPSRARLSHSPAAERGRLLRSEPATGRANVNV